MRNPYFTTLTCLRCGERKPVRLTTRRCEGCDKAVNAMFAPPSTAGKTGTWTKTLSRLGDTERVPVRVIAEQGGWLQVEEIMGGTKHRIRSHNFKAA